MKPFYVVLTALGLFLLLFGVFRIVTIDQSWSKEGMEMLASMNAEDDVRSVYGYVNLDEATYENRKARFYFIERESIYLTRYKNKVENAKIILYIMLLTGLLVTLFGGGKLYTLSAKSKE
jgi:hypothetical protein